MKESKKRRYMADAQKKCRKKKQIEKDELNARNKYLETVLPVLKREMDTLQDEYVNLNEAMQKETRLSYSKTLDRNENILMRQQVACYRNYRKSISTLLQVINEKSCLQNSQYVVQHNFYRLLRKTSQVTNMTISSPNLFFKPTFGSKLGNVSFEISQSSKVVGKEGISRLARIKINDIPLEKKTFLKIFKFLGEDKNFMKYLAGICQPGQKEFVAEWLDNQKTILQMGHVQVDSGQSSGLSPCYFISGGLDASSEINGAVTVVSSLVSDFNKNVDDLWVNEPTNLQIFRMKDGKDENHCNGDFYFYFEDSPLYEKPLFENGSTSRFRDLANLSSLPMQAQSLQVFLNQCLLINATKNL